MTQPPKYSMSKNSYSLVCGLASAIVAGCVIPVEGLPSYDEEVSEILSQYTKDRINRTEEDYFETSCLEMDYLASRLNAVCQKRKVSREAVLAASQVEPFAYNDRTLDFAYMRHGMYVTGVEFVFSDKGCVLYVRTFNLTL